MVDRLFAQFSILDACLYDLVDSNVGKVRSKSKHALSRANSYASFTLCMFFVGIQYMIFISFTILYLM